MILRSGRENPSRDLSRVPPFLVAVYSEPGANRQAVRSLATKLGDLTRRSLVSRRYWFAPLPIKGDSRSGISPWRWIGNEGNDLDCRQGRGKRLGLDDHRRTFARLSVTRR